MSRGLRIREERERLGLTQDEFGALGGVKRLAQSNYESGKREPPTPYLDLLREHGVDVAYIETGIRTPPVSRGKAQPVFDKSLLAEVIHQLDVNLGFISVQVAEEVGVLGAHAFADAIIWLYGKCSENDDVVDQSRQARRYATHLATLLVAADKVEYPDMRPEHIAKLPPEQAEVARLMIRLAELEWQCYVLSGLKWLLQESMWDRQPATWARAARTSRQDFCLKVIAETRQNMVIDGHVSRDQLGLSFFESADLSKCKSELISRIREVDSTIWDDLLEEIKLQSDLAPKSGTALRIAQRTPSEHVANLVRIVMDALHAVDELLGTTYTQQQPATSLQADLPPPQDDLAVRLEAVLRLISANWPKHRR